MPHGPKSVINEERILHRVRLAHLKSAMVSRVVNGHIESSGYQLL